MSSGSGNELRGGLRTAFPASVPEGNPKSLGAASATAAACGLFRLALPLTETRIDCESCSIVTWPQSNDVGNKTNEGGPMSY